MNKLRQCTMQTALFPAQAITVDANGTGVDVRELVDNGKIILAIEAVSGTTPTLAARIQESVTIGGSYADLVPPVAFAGITDSDSEQAIDIDFDRTLGFIRLAIDTGGSTPVYEGSCLLLGRTAQS